MALSPLLAGGVLSAVPVLAQPSYGLGPNAILPGFNSTTFGPNDDGTYPCTSQSAGTPPGCTPSTITLPMSVDFFGTSYNSLYLNNNGNVTFGSPLATYTPYPLSEAGPPIIAPFFADVDTRTGNTVSWGTGTVNGHQAIGFNWPGVGCYSETTSVLDYFQMILVDRSDVGLGDFDVEFNYDQIQWDSGQASGGGSTCLGGTAARAGFASGSGATGSYLEIPGSGENDALLDSNASTGLVHNSYDSGGQSGRYVYQFRGGQPPITTGAPESGTGVGNGDTAANNPTCNVGNFPVNCASGDFWHSFMDLLVPGRGPALDLSRTYNSLEASVPGLFGYGWSSSYDAHLTTNSDGSVTVTSGDGSSVTATSNGGGSYQVPTWADSSLVQNSDGTWTFVQHQTTTYTFSASGDLTAISNPDGYRTTLTDDASGQPVTVTDPAGRQIDLTYGSNGFVSQATGPAGRTVTYTYDAAGNLVAAQDPAGGTWQFAYDGNHLLTSMTGPRGGVVGNVYDSQGRVTSQTDPMGRTTTFAYSGTNYSASGGTTTITDPRGTVTVEDYTNGEMVGKTVGSGTPSAATTTYSFDQDTLGVTSVTDPDGRTTTLTYDPDGNVTSVKDPLGRTTSYTYNGLNEVLTRTDPAGETTTYTYDTQGDETSVSKPLAGSGQTQVTTYGHGDPAHPGDVTTLTDANGKAWTFTYDAYGDLASVTDPLGHTTTHTYDVLGEVTSTVSPNGGTTSYTYDTLGDLTATTDPLGHTTRSTYDADRNVVSSTDAKGNTTAYTYDADNELTKTTRADGSVLSYAFDADGNETSQTDGNGHTTTYAYDPLNRTVSVTDGLGRTTSFTYDAVGNRLTMVDPAGRTTTWSYDADNELTGITYSDGVTPDVSNLTYTPDGQRLSMTDGTGTSTWTYDSLNRLTSYTNGAGATVSYGYDLKGQVTSITYPGSVGTVARGYDAAGHLTSVTDFAGHTTTFGYDADSNNTSETFPAGTGLTDTFAYNQADQVTGITDTKGSSTTASFGYTRDQNGQVTSVTATGVPNGSHTYTYDALNQIAGVDTSSYGYDPAGNPTQLASGTTQSFDAANELTSSSAGSFTYDGEGSRTQGPGTLGGTATYTYDQADRLTGTVVSGGTANAAGLVAGGEYHSLAVTQSGTVYAWGYNGYGQLGDGNTTSTDVPVQVTGITSATAVSAGDLSSAALLAGGGVETWGYNGYGELGNGTTTSSTSPVAVSGLSGATAVAAGNYHVLALKSNGTVVAWGLNNAGQLGDGTTTGRTTPVAVTGLSGVTQVAAGGLPGYAGQSVALESNGTVWTWGYGKQGQLGRGSQTSSPTPTQVPGLSGIVQIAANGADTYALQSNGTVWAWGDNSYGQIGNTNAGHTQSTPIQVDISGVTSIGAGGSAAFAVKSDGTVWGWGDDNTGQLGDGGACGKTCTTPVQAKSLSGAIAVAGGYVHTLAVRNDGTVWAWGRNAEGELGDGNTTVSTTPVEVSGLSGVKPIPPVTATYRYNGDGLRMSKTVNGTTESFAYDVSSSTPLVLVDGTTSYVYGPGNLPLEEVTAGGTYYYHHDQLGSTRVLSDGSGNTVATYSYDPYGNLIGSTGTVVNPFRYAGAYTDLETGLLYLVNRYYDPATAQFLSVDPLAGITQSAYGYVGDDPLNGLDPLGLHDCGLTSLWGCVQNGYDAVTGGVSTAAGWVYDNVLLPIGQAAQWVWNGIVSNASNISAAAGIAALAVLPIPVVGEIASPILGAVAVVTGAIATYNDVASGNYLMAAVDALGTLLGGAGLGADLASRLTMEAAVEAWDAGEAVLSLAKTAANEEEIGAALDRVSAAIASLSALASDLCGG